MKKRAVFSHTLVGGRRVVYCLRRRRRDLGAANANDTRAHTRRSRRRVSSLFLSAADHRADLSPPHRWPFFTPDLPTDDATTDATAPKYFQNAFSGVPRRSFRAQSSQYALVLPPLELFVVRHPSDIHKNIIIFETRRRKTIVFFTRTRVDAYARRP